MSVIPAATSGKKALKSSAGFCIGMIAANRIINGLPELFEIQRIGSNLFVRFFEPKSKDLELQVVEMKRHIAGLLLNLNVKFERPEPDLIRIPRQPYG